MNNFDVIVIGAGFAGLSTVALLGKAGAKVALIEQDHEVGGRARVMEQGGYRLEYGLHTFRHAEQGSAAALMAELGRPLRFVEGHFPHVLARGRELLPLEGALAPADGKPNKKAAEQRAKMGAIAVRLLQADPEAWFDKSFAEFLGEDAGHEALEEFYRLLGFAVMEPDPKALSAGELIAFLKQAAAARGRVGDLVGGTKQLFDSLTGAIAETGGSLFLGTRVQRLETADKRVTRVLTSSDELSAGAVVYTAPLPGLFGIIEENKFKAKLVKRIKTLAPTSGIALDYGLRRPVSDIKGCILDPAERVMGRFPSNVDPSVAPEGKQLANWFMMLDPEECEDRDRVRSRIHALRSRVRRIFEGFDEAVEWERILFLPVVDGAAPHPGQSRPLRPEFAVKEFSNLFFAGDTTAGAGVSGDIAFDSARRAAPLALKAAGQAGG